MFYKTPSHNLTNLSLNNITYYTKILYHHNNTLTIHYHTFNTNHNPNYNSLIKLPNYQNHINSTQSHTP